MEHSRVRDAVGKGQRGKKAPLLPFCFLRFAFLVVMTPQTEQSEKDLPAKIHVLHMINLAPQESRRQPLELIDRIRDEELKRTVI
jgi:hypothetical protein